MVKILNEKPLVSYYLVSSYVFKSGFHIKLKKDQYFKVLILFLNSKMSFDNAHFYLKLLNAEIISAKVLKETENQSLHLIFPQVFTVFSANESDSVKEFFLFSSITTLKTKKMYISKLWVKHYDFLKNRTAFFEQFPAVKNLDTSETAMIEYLDSLISDKVF